nr:hypothetical protein C56E10.3 - Caenorhabditis elegans [Caenorhabditis elegans]
MRSTSYQNTDCENLVCNVPLKMTRMLLIFFFCKKIMNRHNPVCLAFRSLFNNVSQKTEGKRKQLDKKCGEYEQLCKKTAKLKAEKSRLDVESTQLTAQSDEIDQSFTKVEQNAEASFLLQQQKNNEMNEAVQQWAAVDVKEEKLYVDLTHETELEKQFKERYDEITRNLELLGAEAGSDEKLYYQMESAFDNDMRTEKTLEQYLTRLIDDVFVNQRRLEDIQIGTSRGRANFRQAEKALRDQRTRHRRLSSQITGTTVTKLRTKIIKSVYDDGEMKLCSESKAKGYRQRMMFVIKLLRISFGFQFYPPQVMTF